MTTPVKTYYDFFSHQSISGRWRNNARDLAVYMLSLGRSINRTTGWIRFPYYHHVFDDERAGFARQLDYIKQFGDFISLSNAVDMLVSGRPIDGRYFCITFDDGFKNNLINAVPILVDQGVSAAFFLTTGYIGSSIDKERDHLLKFFNHGRTLIEFLNWDDCRLIIAAGMEIGSHTVHHARLSLLDDDAVRKELATSKKVIEENLGQPCVHFCAPFGIPITDFNPERDPRLAHDAGYRCMLTTKRGPMLAGSDVFRICRDHILANWGNHQLRYFLSRD